MLKTRGRLICFQVGELGDATIRQVLEYFSNTRTCHEFTHELPGDWATPLPGRKPRASLLARVLEVLTQKPQNISPTPRRSSRSLEEKKNRSVPKGELCQNNAITLLNEH